MATSAPAFEAICTIFSDSNPQLLLKTIEMEKFRIYFPYLPRLFNNVSIDDVLEDRIDTFHFAFLRHRDSVGPLESSGKRPSVVPKLDFSQLKGRRQDCWATGKHGKHVELPDYDIHGLDGFWGAKWGWYAGMMGIGIIYIIYNHQPSGVPMVQETRCGIAQRRLVN